MAKDAFRATIRAPYTTSNQPTIRDVSQGYKTNQGLTENPERAVKYLASACVEAQDPSYNTALAFGELLAFIEDLTDHIKDASNESRSLDEVFSADLLIDADQAFKDIPDALHAAKEDQVVTDDVDELILDHLKSTRDALQNKTDKEILQSYIENIKHRPGNT